MPKFMIFYDNKNLRELCCENPRNKVNHPMPSLARNELRYFCHCRGNHISLSRLTLSLLLTCPLTRCGYEASSAAIPSSIDTLALMLGWMLAKNG